MPRSETRASNNGTLMPPNELQGLLTGSLASVVNELLSPYQKTLSLLVLGTWFMTTLYGIVCLQIYYYYFTYPKDSKWTKSLISFVLIIMTLHVVFGCMSFYLAIQIKTLFGGGSVDSILWSMSASELCHYMITALYYVHFIKLIYTLMSTNLRWRYAITLSLGGLALAHTTLGIYSTGHYLHRLPTLPDTVTDTLQLQNFAIPLLVPVYVLQIVTDTALAIVLCTLLRLKQKTEHRRTWIVISNLIMLALGRGILTSAGAFVVFIQVAAVPHAFWYISVLGILGGLYANSILVALNSREAIGRGLASGKAMEKLAFSLPLSGIQRPSEIHSAESSDISETYAGKAETASAVSESIGVLHLGFGSTARV